MGNVYPCLYILGNMVTFEKTILLVDDNISIYKSLSPLLLEKGFYCLYAGNFEEAARHYSSSSVDLTLLDIRLGDEDGMSILKKLLSYNTDIPIIMITAFGTIETAVQAIQFGAKNYIQKPINFKKLFTIIEKHLQTAEENSNVLNVNDSVFSLNSEMQEIIEKVKVLATSDIPILIQGESGTGKEVLADFIHKNSQHRGKKAVKINCSSFNESLLENELFGHEKGAYTGAGDLFKGVFERADKSTLFLDEIGDMPLSLQAKILRAIQNKEIRRLGGKEDLNIDVRFIAATNKDLPEMIKEKTFRKDLYYRLNTATVILPPLRDRIEDIEHLSAIFIKKKGSNKHLSKETTLLFKTFSWPGNIRELENVINYALVLARNDEIRINDLPPYLNTKETPYSLSIKKNNEEELILKALKTTNNHKSAAAQLLGISRKTLYNKMKHYEIRTN